MDTEKEEGRKASDFKDALKELEGEEVVLRLYVANTQPSSVSATHNVRAFCNKYLKGPFDLQIIDIYKEPRVARAEQIVATPTLIKVHPLPVKRFVGNMSNQEVLLAGLGLR